MKNYYHDNGLKLKHSQRGQSMIEYTVVAVFGILTITTGPMKDTITDVRDAIRSNYAGYTYAISFSDLPDSDSVGAYETLLESQSDPSHQKTNELIARLTQHAPSAYHNEIKTYNVQKPDPVSIIQTQITNLTNITIP